MSLPSSETIISQFYTEGGAHGQEHAQAAVDLVREIAQEPEYAGKLTEEALLLIEIAAAFHDAGYAGKEPYWSGTQWEHPIVSAQIMYDFLQKHVELITQGQMAVIAMLILNHDEAGHRMPALHRFEMELYGSVSGIATPPRPAPGMIATPPRPFPGIGYEVFGELDYADEIEQYPFEIMLQILREADGRLGTAERTMEFSLGRGVPAVSDDGGRPGVGLPAWQATGLANVQCAARRAALDAFTRTGRQKAWEIIQAANQFCLRILAEQGLSDPLTNFCPLDRADLENYLWTGEARNQCYLGTRITQAFPLSSLPTILAVTEPHSLLLQHYGSSVVPTDSIAISSDVLPEQVAVLAAIRERILANYAIDILTEVPGALRVWSDLQGEEREYELVPPILQRDFQPNQLNQVSRLKDGAWVALAKELGKSHIRVLVPLVAQE